MNDLRGKLGYVDLSRETSNCLHGRLANVCRLARFVECPNHGWNNEMHVFFCTRAKDKESVEETQRRRSLWVYVCLERSKHRWNKSGQIDLEFSLQSTRDRFNEG